MVLPGSARDTLRLEAGMPLYGNELGRDGNPYEAGLGRVVKLDKPGDSSAAPRSNTSTRRPAPQPGRPDPPRPVIARHGHEVHEAGADEAVGVVTSGAPSPTLGMPIAMAYVPPADAAVGTMVEIAIRDARVEADIVPLPFYKRSRA